MKPSDSDRALAAGKATVEEPHAAVRRIVGPTILLFGGAYFDLLDPEGSAFTIEDVAQGLAQCCRFAGQCRRFYSVAEHSVHVSTILEPEHRYAGLMHDAAEAFLGDVTKPLKLLLPDYRAIEARVEAAVFARFAVPTPLPLAVKDADRIMLATEQRQLMANGEAWAMTGGRRALPLAIPAWPPEEARERFLERFGALAPKEMRHG